MEPRVVTELRRHATAQRLEQRVEQGDIALSDRRELEQHRAALPAQWAHALCEEAR
jgi:hypothetical protein